MGDCQETVDLSSMLLRDPTANVYPKPQSSHPNGHRGLVGATATVLRVGNWDDRRGAGAAATPPSRPTATTTSAPDPTSSSGSAAWTRSCVHSHQAPQPPTPPITDAELLLARFSPSAPTSAA